MHEFMNAKLVGLCVVQSIRHVCPPVVVSARPLCRVPNPISPVIAVRKTAAWPAKIRDSNPPQVIDELFTNAVDIRNFRVPSDPNAIVDDATEMLDELPVNMGADLGTRILGRNLDFGVRAQG
jgi:hypothetical protein